MKVSRVALLLVLSCPAFAASAQTLKPGLWEVQHKVQGNPELERQIEEARKQLAAMHPEQRKQVEAMMGSRGVHMAGHGRVRMCLTREMVERNEIPAAQGDCRITQQQRTGKTLKAAFTCINPPSSGESEITFNSPEAYSMKTTATSTVSGKPETMTVAGDGKWVAADCGSVKPVQAPPARK
jgi:Protein of unknown function (DUF3617)